ncbi:MAG: hypothetical protein WCP29_18280 [Acidobacteriota bacterium]
MSVVPLTAPVPGPPVRGPANVAPPLLELAPPEVPPLELLVDPPLLELLLELLDPPLDVLVDPPPLELPLLPDPPAGVHPGAWPADNNMPFPSAIYIEQSGNVTLPSTIE